MYTPLLVGPPTVRNSTWILASPNHLWLIRLPVCGTTSRIPSRSRCHAEGPSSLSHSFSFILAHESMLLPSNSTTAPTGGFMPSDGGVRVTCCRSKVSWPLEALKWPVLIVPFHSPPVKVTVSPDRAPCITATGLSLGTSNWRKVLGCYFLASSWRGNWSAMDKSLLSARITCATKPSAPCQSPRSASGTAQKKGCASSTF